MYITLNLKLLFFLFFELIFVLQSINETWKLRVLNHRFQCIGQRLFTREAHFYLRKAKSLSTHREPTFFTQFDLRLPVQGPGFEL